MENKLDLLTTVSAYSRMEGVINEAGRCSRSIHPDDVMDRDKLQSHIAKNASDGTSRERESERDVPFLAECDGKHNKALIATIVIIISR